MHFPSTEAPENGECHPETVENAKSCKASRSLLLTESNE